MAELVRVERREAIAIVTINRPEVRNALNPAALAELRAALEFVGRNPAVACAVLAGEGGTFTTGDDLTETAAMDDVGFADMIEGFQSITRALRGMAMPVIAAIEGYAVGGGLEIAAACDLRVCAEDTIFFCPEVRLGLLLSNGSSSILPRLIGAGRTRELMLTDGHGTQRLAGGDGPNRQRLFWQEGKKAFLLEQGGNRLAAFAERCLNQAKEPNIKHESSWTTLLVDQSRLALALGRLVILLLIRKKGLHLVQERERHRVGELVDDGVRLFHHLRCLRPLPLQG